MQTWFHQDFIPHFLFDYYVLNSVNLYLISVLKCWLFYMCCQRLRSLYSKILATVQTMPQDAAYRKYTEQLVNERLNHVKTVRNKIILLFKHYSHYSNMTFTVCCYRNSNQTADGTSKHLTSLPFSSVQTSLWPKTSALCLPGTATTTVEKFKYIFFFFAGARYWKAGKQDQQWTNRRSYFPGASCCTLTSLYWKHHMGASNIMNGLWRSNHPVTWSLFFHWSGTGWASTGVSITQKGYHLG